MRRPPIILLACAVLVAAATALLIWLPEPTLERTTGPLPQEAQEAYVWQRSWTLDLHEAISDAKLEMSRLVVLAAEVSFRNGIPHTVRVPLDYQVLKASSVPVGLSLRIGSYAGL